MRPAQMAGAQCVGQKAAGPLVDVNTQASTLHYKHALHCRAAAALVEVLACLLSWI